MESRKILAVQQDCSSYIKITIFFGSQSLALVNLSFALLILGCNQTNSAPSLHWESDSDASFLCLRYLSLILDIVELSLEKKKGDQLPTIVSVLGIIEGSLSLSALVLLHCIGHDKVKKIEFSFKSIAFVWCCGWVCVVLRKKKNKKKQRSF